MTRQFYYFYSSILPSIMTFLVNYFFSKHMSLTEYGFYGVYYPVFNLVLPFVLWGQASVIMMQYFEENRTSQKALSAEVSQALYIMLGCFLLFGFLLIMAEKLLSISWLQGKDEGLLYLILFAALTESVKQFFYTLSNCLDDYKGFFWTTNIQAVIFAVSLYLMPDLQGLFVAILLSNILCSLYLFVFLSLKYHIKFQPRIQLQLSKTMFILGWPSILSMFLSSAFIYCDRFMINYFKPDIFAYYVLASSLAVGIGVAGISAVLRGQTIRSMIYLQNRKFPEFKRNLVRVEWFLLGLCGLSFILNYILGKSLFIQLFGERFESSFQYIAVLCIGVIILAAAQFYSLILVQLKKMSTIVLLQAVALAFNLVMSFLLSHFFKVEFILLSLLLTNCLYFAMIYWISYRDLFSGAGESLYFPKYLFVTGFVLFGFIFKGNFLA